MNDKTPITDSSFPSDECTGVSGGSILGHIWASIGATLVLGIICCGLYPLVVYGLGQLIFPIQANGSLVTRDGTPTSDDAKAVGSSLIGQAFSVPGYFHPRPSAANNSPGSTTSTSSYSPAGGYDATSSGGTNFGPLSDELINGLTGVPPTPSSTPAPATQTAASQAATAPSTQTASAPPAATASATAPAASAPATQPAKVVFYDGIRLRVIHYCLDNGIKFKLYTVKNDGATRIAEVPLAKFQDKDSNLNDVALIDAFPHPGDPDTKTPVIAADFAVLIPADAVTASGSGLDPHITPENAALQAPRIADARKLPKDKVLDLIKQNTDQPNLGFLGDPGVNVLRLNIALDRLAPLAPATAPAAATSPAPAATAPASAPATQ